MVLSRLWTGWSSALVVVKPATVIAWHRQAARRYWRWRSRRPGRPRIPRDHIALVRRISGQHPAWGEDRVAEEVAVKLGVRHSTSTIRRYMVRSPEPRGGRTWKTFMQTSPIPSPPIASTACDPGSIPGAGDATERNGRRRGTTCSGRADPRLPSSGVENPDRCDRTRVWVGTAGTTFHRAAGGTPAVVLVVRGSAETR